MTTPENDLSPVPPGEPANPFPPQPPRPKKETIFTVFDPTGKHLITAILIGLNLLVFIVMAFSGVNLMQPTSESLLKWGANFRPYTLDGQWWRLITCCFIHIGIFHVLINMYALLNIGIMLERLLGRTKYLVAYLLTGLIASLASLAWNSATISAGASGAIFGVYGLFLGLLTTPLIHPDVRKPLLKSMLFFVVLNLSIGATGIVDNAAHAGGLVSGFLLAYAFYPALRKPWSRGLQYVVVLLPILVVLTGSFLVYRNLPNPIGVYEQKMKAFDPRNTQAETTRAQIKEYTKGPQRDSVTSKSIAYYNQNIQLVKEIDKLKLPDELKERDKKLILYCQLQIHAVQLYVQSLDEDTPALRQLMDENSRQLDALNKEFADNP